MTPAALANAALRLRAGAPLAIVADDAETTPGRLRRALRRYLVPLAAIREDGRTARRWRCVERSPHYTASEIAAREGVHVTAVLADLHRAGVEVRPVGRPRRRA